MISKKNTYFENIKRICHDWKAARVEREARKQQIIDTFGLDSNELRVWYEEDIAVDLPFRSGVLKAYRAWKDSLFYKEDELEIDDFLGDDEVADFIEALRSAGIETFVYTNQNTAVMRNIHAFVTQGCTMIGLCTITRQEPQWGDEEPANQTRVMGIRFSLN